MKNVNKRIQYRVAWHIWNRIHNEIDANIGVNVRRQICDLIRDPNEPMPPDPVLEPLWNQAWEEIMSAISHATLAQRRLI
jgi:hypothetical protein